MSAAPDAEVVIAAGSRLAAEAARLASFGWMRGTSGNLSEVLERAPLRLAITASGIDKGELSATDVVMIDEHGDPVHTDGLTDRRPSAEAGLHARIATVTGAGAVVHVHALSAVVAGHRWPEGVQLRDVEMLKGIGRDAHDDLVTVPVIPNSQDMTVLGDTFVEHHRGDVPALIVAGHGMYVWGADLLPYLQVYEPGLRQCDPNHWPEEFPFVTTRYSPAVQPLPGVTAFRREKVGVTDIVVYRRDASLKTYGLSRFVFRP